MQERNGAAPRYFKSYYPPVKGPGLEPSAVTGGRIKK